MSALWIEYAASDDTGAARWNASASDEQIDSIIAHAISVLGQPDTVS